MDVEQMVTYNQIQEYIKKKYGYSVKTCWIADVKEICGLNPRVAPNRELISKRKYPCPPDKINSIKDAFKHLGMI